MYFRSTPPESIPFEFSCELLGDGVGSLQAGILAVDSLTVDSLKLRLGDLEQRLRDVSNEHREKQTLLSQHEAEVANIKKSSSQDVNTASRLEYRYYCPLGVRVALYIFIWLFRFFQFMVVKRLPLSYIAVPYQEALPF